MFTSCGNVLERELWAFEIANMGSIWVALRGAPTHTKGPIFTVATLRENAIYGIPGWQTPPRPIYPQKGHYKRFLKNKKNRQKNHSEKSYMLPTAFFFGFSTRFFFRNPTSVFRKIDFSQNSGNFSAIRKARWKALDKSFSGIYWSGGWFPVVLKPVWIFWN